MASISVSLDTQTILDVEKIAAMKGIKVSRVMDMAAIFFARFELAEGADDIRDTFEILSKALRRRGWIVNVELKPPMRPE